MEEPAADGAMAAEKSRHLRKKRRGHDDRVPLSNSTCVGQGSYVDGIFNGIKTEHPSKRGAEISFFP